MARYARLSELGFDTDESELFEVFDDLSGRDEVVKPGRPSVETERVHHQNHHHQKNVRGNLYTVPSTELATEIFSQLQNSKGYPDSHRVAQQQVLQEKLQNLENGNPNVCPPDPTTQPAVVAICSHSSIAAAAAPGPSLQEQQRAPGGGRRGGWVGRNIEERGNRWRATGGESFLNDNSATVLDNSGSIYSNAASCIRRGTSHRDREPVLDLHQSQNPVSSRMSTQSHYSQPQETPFRVSTQSHHSQPQETPFRVSTQSHHTQPQETPFRVSTQSHHSQPQETQCCNLHSSCSSDARKNCQRFSQESSAAAAREGRLNASIAGSERNVPSVSGAFVQERAPIFQRSSSAREAAGLQRSSSTGGQRSEMSREQNWRDHAAAPKSAPVSVRTKHRVSFSLTENHEAETQKLREKFREPAVTLSKKGAQAQAQAQQQQQTSAANQQPLRYNYEQPGFVEREKENICAGKAYTIYGVKDVKDFPKGTSGRQHHLVRAFSLRENASTYVRMPRAYSVNAGAGRHAMPMPMECGTCGKGGIVCLGFPEDDADVHQACRCGERKPPKKKKSIMEYCRKIFRLPQKPR